jgi:hypothetical protein
MTYTKPEINLLGDADQLIQNIEQKPMSAPLDVVSPFTTDPAYNLDE